MAGEASCGSVDIESDPWISLTVSWWPRGQGQPLYLFVTGTDGGYVELKADPTTGALVEVIVIGEPPALKVDPRGSEEPAVILVDKTPVLDRAIWALANDGQYAEGIRPAYITMHGLVMYQSEDVTILRFSDARIVTQLKCNGVTVGVSADDALVSLEARLGS